MLSIAWISFHYSIYKNQNYLWPGTIKLIQHTLKIIQILPKSCNLCLSLCSKCVHVWWRLIFQWDPPTQMCCHEIPWSHTEEFPAEVRFAVAEEPGWVAPSITQHCAALCGSETMGRCRGERQATWTWHRKLLKLHKTNCWALAFPPTERLSPPSLKVNSIA